jgi:hemoglobin-like flavoprotein
VIRNYVHPEAPSMTPEQVRLVKDSFRHVAPIRDQAAAMFYDNLFKIDPSVKQLFSSADLEKQGGKLMTALAFVVQGLDRADTILPTVRELARRHVRYGVTPKHYAVVGEALIVTLASGLGTAFTVEVCEAWRAAYALLARVMIEAAAEEPAVA